MNKEEIEQQIKDLDFKIDQLDIKQFTLKIFLNRIYGCYANKYSPFYDLDLASSITITGQECIKSAGRMADEFLKEKYKIEEKASCILYSDTDSLYLTIKPTLDKLGKDLTVNESEITPEAHVIVDNLEQYLNSAIQEWAKKELHSLDSRLQFKREAICDVGIFLEKKRYILHILDEEGIPCDKTKYVGVEVASTNVPKLVKPLIKTIVETMIKTKSQDETNKVYRDTYDKFKTLKIEEIAFPRGVNSFKKYASNVKALNTIKGTPCAVKASIAYNYFIDKLDIGSKYEKIHGGGKIKFFYAVKNPWRVDAIAFIDEYPKEFQLVPDFDKMFQKSVGAAIERLYNTVKWKLITPNQVAETNLIDLLK